MRVTALLFACLLVGCSESGASPDATTDLGGDHAVPDQGAPDAPNLQTTSTPIGVGGGVATSADGRATLTLPPLAVPSTIAFTIAGIVNLPLGVTGVGYDIGPTGLVFAKAAQLAIQYDEAALGGLDESKLALGVVIGGKWHLVPGSTVDVAANHVTAQVEHLSTYGVVSSWVEECGNGAIESGEQCDGAALAGETCASQGFASGALACRQGCIFDYSACTHELVPVAAGSFTMGSPPTELCRDTNETQHDVMLTHAYEIGAVEVTQGAFQALLGFNPSYFKSCGPRCPVEYVNWYEAALYVNALSVFKGLEPCYDCVGHGAAVTCVEAPAFAGSAIYACQGFRLPTEAEWENAYRSGTTTPYYNGTNSHPACPPCATGGDPVADLIGWYDCNAGLKTHPVKQKVANAWGLHDMPGNVAEWAHDVYLADLGSTAVTDPWGAAGSGDRLLRGGYWDNCACQLRAAARKAATPDTRGSSTGFRVARTK